MKSVGRSDGCVVRCEAGSGGVMGLGKILREIIWREGGRGSLSMEEGKVVVDNLADLKGKEKVVRRTRSWLRDGKV